MFGTLSNIHDEPFFAKDFNRIKKLFYRRFDRILNTPLGLEKSSLYCSTVQKMKFFIKDFFSKVHIKSKAIPRNFHMLWDSIMLLSNLATTLRFSDMQIISISLINFNLHINSSAHSDCLLVLSCPTFFKIKLTSTCRSFTNVMHKLSSLESFLYICNVFQYISL